MKTHSNPSINWSLPRINSNLSKTICLNLSETIRIYQVTLLRSNAATSKHTFSFLFWRVMNQLIDFITTCSHFKTPVSPTSKVICCQIPSLYYWRIMLHSTSNSLRTFFWFSLDSLLAPLTLSASRLRIMWLEIGMVGSQETAQTAQIKTFESDRTGRFWRVSASHRTAKCMAKKSIQFCEISKLKDFFKGVYLRDFWNRLSRSWMESRRSSRDCSSPAPRVLGWWTSFS